MKCPESMEELEELEKALPLCRVTLYEQAKARIEVGEAHSVREASRQLGEELDRSPRTVERAIQREQETRTTTLSQLAGTEKHRPSNEQFRTSFTGDNEWCTPVEYIEAAREVMGSIDLDPATSLFGQNRIRARLFYTEEKDGLLSPWAGTVWLNPPYAQPLIYQFIEKLVSEWTAGNLSQAILLTHNYTDTAWFHLAESVAAFLCFTKGRVKFEKADGTIAAPTQGSAFFYFGHNGEEFKRIFGQFGFIR